MMHLRFRLPIVPPSPTTSMHFESFRAILQIVTIIVYRLLYLPLFVFRLKCCFDQQKTPEAYLAITLNLCLVLLSRWAGSKRCSLRMVARNNQYTQACPAQ